MPCWVRSTLTSDDVDEEVDGVCASVCVWPLADAWAIETITITKANACCIFVSLVITTTSSINQVGISHRQLNKLYRTLLLSLGYLVKSSGQMHVPTLWDTSMVQSQVNHRRSSLLLVCTGTRHSIMISINDRYCTKPIKRSIEHSSRLRLSLHCQPAWRRITNRENDPRTHTHI